MYTDNFCNLHDDYAKLTHLLTKRLTKSASLKVCESFHCFACKDNYPKSEIQAGNTQSSTDKFIKEYFQIAFFKVDWYQLPGLLSRKRK